MDLKLSNIFILTSDKQDYSKEELLALEIKSDFIQDLEKQLGLNYLENQESPTNVCFANEKRLRPEFKIFFHKTDIVDFLNRVLQKDDFNIKLDKIPFPENDEDFWEKIK